MYQALFVSFLSFLLDHFGDVFLRNIPLTEQVCLASPLVSEEKQFTKDAFIGKVACDNLVGLALVLLYLEDIKCLWGKCKVFLKKYPRKE